MDNDVYIYRSRKIYNKDIMYLNSLILNETKRGFVFRTPLYVKESIEYYDSLEYTKQNYEKLEKSIMNFE